MSRETPGAAAPDDLGAEIALLTPRLRAFARSLSADDAEADDLVQETCVRAMGARDRFVPGTNLRAWLFAILRNLHVSNRRDATARLRRLVDEPVTDVSLASGGRTVEEEALDRLAVDEVVTAFRSLPPPYAAPLHLVAVEDLSYAQVAAILGIPVGTVMSRVYRARRLLMSRLPESEP